jgi:membrane protein implicated in regulation of membrane protease activity
MGTSASTAWWLIAGVLVAVELATGTFYLLMLALGAAAGAVAAHLGWGVPAQLVSAAVVGAGTTFGWHMKRKRDGVASNDRDQNLDIGEHVDVPRWHADGSAQVHFRGSTWQARFDGAGPPAPGRHTIVRLDGNRLVLRRA